MAFIEQLAAMEGENVTLRGWVANKRSSKGLVFIILRDGTGRCQCVADASAISAETFDLAGQLTQESSIEVSGLVLQDERSEEHTSELQSLMRNSYAVFCLKKKNTQKRT